MKNLTFGVSRFPLSILATLVLAFNVCAAHEECSCSTVDKDEATIVDLASSNTNEMCPVMTGQRADDQWTTIYKGKLVRFCCNNCITSFRQEPEKYVAVLPQFQTLPGGQVSTEKDAATPNYLAWFARIGLLILAVAFCFCPAKSGASWFARFFAVLLVFAALYATYLHQTNKRLKLELVKQYTTTEIHRATYYDYGVPPVPDNPGVQPELSKSFYRGNDERSPVLYNGGNYQTAQFDVEIQYADGTPVHVGDSLNNRSLYLEFTIHKPDKAALRFYDDKMMDRIYLTRSYEPMMGWDEPIADKTPIQTIRDGEVWRCRYPLDISSTSNVTRFNLKTVTREKLAAVQGVGRDVADWFVSYRDAGYPIVGPEDLRQAGITGKPARIISASLNETTYEGLVYVCEAFFHKDFQHRQLGARFHYGIKYDIQVGDGMILDGSEIWMGALSRSLKAKKGALPDNEWLSSEPLPQLPAAQNLSDKLLGIDDYDF